MWLQILFTLSVVVVGLEETSYITREDENFVEICAVIHEPNISCPCLHPFYLTVWTESNTAGATEYSLAIAHYSLYYSSETLFL